LGESHVLRTAVFLDRDGVVNPLCYDAEHGTVDSPLNAEQFQLLPGVAESVRLLRSLGFLCIVVSNQPIVAKGKSTLALLQCITERMHRELAKGNTKLDGVYYCLHHPQAALAEYRVDCDCRKPKAGLLLQASQELSIDLARSYMIGDGLTDVQAGKRAGCVTIWLGEQRCDVCRIMQAKNVTPNFTAHNLPAAAELIRSFCKD
jgi:D-glycero-D-manno-heptose 1,7-bisphosphate phosphatase